VILKFKSACEVDFVTVYRIVSMNEIDDRKIKRERERETDGEEDWMHIDDMLDYHIIHETIHLFYSTIY
jgi:hypothetical protein